MNKKLEWFSTKQDITDKEINFVEKTFKLKFPEDFKECIKKNNGGSPSLEVYDFEGHKEAVFNRLLNFNSENKNYIINNYNWIRDRLVPNIIPFAEDPFGNLICFDYREGKEKPPKIVFWDHEIAAKDKEKAIQHICNSLTELLNMLYDPEEK